MARTIIRKIRQEKEMTQQELADILGVTRATVSNYEIRRREPSPDILQKLKEYFDLNDQTIGEIVLDYAKKKNASGNC